MTSGAAALARGRRLARLGLRAAVRGALYLSLTIGSLGLGFAIAAALQL